MRVFADEDWISERRSVFFETKQGIDTLTLHHFKN